MNKSWPHADTSTNAKSKKGGVDFNPILILFFAFVIWFACNDARKNGNGDDKKKTDTIQKVDTLEADTFKKVR